VDTSSTNGAWQLLTDAVCKIKLQREIEKIVERRKEGEYSKVKERVKEGRGRRSTKY
jgi:hypothetical protein